MNNLKKLGIALIMLFSGVGCYSQTSSTTGNWTTGSTWVGGSAPTLTGGAGNLNSDVTIEYGHTVTLNSDMTVKNGATLIVKGTLIITSGGNVDFENGSIILVQTGGTLEMNGLTNSNNSTNVTIHGTLIVNGNYTAGTGAEISGNGDMSVSGTSSGSGSTFGTTLSCSECAIDGSTGSIENAIIDGSQTAQHAPIEPYWNWTYSQQIYLQSEIAQDGVITRLAFEYNGYSSWTDQIEIYMGHTSKTSFSSTSNWVSYSDLTKVYDGNYTVSSTKGWYWIDFDTDFNYNNTDNLVVAVYEKTSGYHSASDEFYTDDVGTYRVLTYYDDWSNPNPSSPPTADYRSKYVPSLKMEFGNVGSPLPITLINFGHEILPNEQIELSWVVGSQINNDYFTILRSKDGYYWEELDQVLGDGTYPTPREFVWIDQNPIYGLSYYRLKQTDYDGQSEIFWPISVNHVERLYVVKEYMINGQECPSDYNGIIIRQWNNGEYDKIIKSKK